MSFVNANQTFGAGQPAMATNRQQMLAQMLQANMDQQNAPSQPVSWTQDASKALSAYALGSYMNSQNGAGLSGMSQLKTGLGNLWNTGSWAPQPDPMQTYQAGMTGGQ